MKSAARTLAVGLALAGGLSISAVCAEEEPRALPTLLIKGEVVSVDTTDPAATLLKVKDRYGFETPIYLEQATKITQGDQDLTVANLTAGTAVEVEYNFDVNTAKRHAVTVKMPAPAPSTEAAAPPAMPPVPAPPMPEPVAPQSILPGSADATTGAAPVPEATPPVAQ